MNIIRQRYIVRRKEDNKILVGLARNKYFVSENEITDSTPIQTYVSAQKAISAASMSYKRTTVDDYYAEAVIESYQSGEVKPI